MITFDEIRPIAMEILTTHRETVAQLDWLVLNRDLNARVRLIVPQLAEELDKALRPAIDALYKDLSERLAPHAYAADSGILFEQSLEQVCAGASAYRLYDDTSNYNFENKVWLVDRLATQSNWAHIANESQGVPRVVFFSIKGGVGRSTALAATAWHLAQAGKKVLVLDLDLESPGLSTSLLPAERLPQFGITDWLIEDLVDNGDTVFDSMVATSDLSHDGEILVVPAHGQQHGEYIAKLSRVWMSKLHGNGRRETWSARLERLLQLLELRFKPDVVLIDSRSGIDEIAAACITELGAHLILLFALEGTQTWNGYRMLFEQWLYAGVAPQIRDRLKIVAAIVPELDRVSYLQGLRENAYTIFLDTLYDQIDPANPGSIGLKVEADTKAKWHVGERVDGWSFDEADEGAPHHPWAVHRHRSFAGLRSLQGRLASIDRQEVQAIFGPLLEGVEGVADIGP